MQAGAPRTRIPACIPPASYRYPYRFVNSLAVPHLENQEGPERVAIVGGVFRFVLTKQVFDEVAAEVAALERARGKQNIVRQFAQPPVRLEPRRYRNTEAVFLLLDNLGRQ